MRKALVNTHVQLVNCFGLIKKKLGYLPEVVAKGAELEFDLGGIAVSN